MQGVDRRLAVLRLLSLPGAGVCRILRVAVGDGHQLGLDAHIQRIAAVARRLIAPRRLAHLQVTDLPRLPLHDLPTPGAGKGECDDDGDFHQVQPNG